MDRESLEFRANLAEQKRLTEEIKASQNTIKKLKKGLDDIRLRKFHQHHRVGAKEVVEKYVDRLRECCYQGGRGYKYWLCGPYARKPGYCHCVVEPSKYEKAKPTQCERDAWWALTGEEMKVTSKTHVERWGN